MEKQYSIGEVAKITGISRDRLRYYEEKNILRPAKNIETNYRMYQSRDIDMVLAIEFYRAMDFNMQQLQEIWKHCDYQNVELAISKKEKEIEDKIKIQEEYLKNLRQGQEACKMIKQNLNNFSVREMPPFQILGEMEEFRAFKEYKKIHNIKSKHENNTIIRMLKREITFDDAGIVSTKMLITIEDSQLMQEKETIHYNSCVYIIIEDNNLGEDITNQVYEKSHHWMKQNNLEGLGKAYINNILIMVDETQTNSYLELYIPLKYIKIH